MIFRYKKQGDHICAWGDQWILDNPVRGMLHPPKKIFKTLVESGMTVVDTGCGTGFFTLALARMVGEAGKVIGVDIQDEALKRVDAKAAITGLNGIIETVKGTANNMGNLPTADFALAFYMAHEVPDIDSYFKQMHRCIRSGGRLLLAEPKFHVSRPHFANELAAARNAGFTMESTPAICFSHATVLKRS